MQTPDVIVVGAGVAGLSCALKLHQAGLSLQLLEGSEEVGGRIRTDTVDGFLLDRGFQVLLTAYPSAQQLLSYEDLKLHRFEPGALIRYRGKFRRLSDPFRRPRHLISTALSPVASLGDKLRVMRLRRRLQRLSAADLLARPEAPTVERLRNDGFSDRIIERFFRPFLGGVFLESGLSTSSRKFEYLFKMFSSGEAVLPGAGMQAIPQQLANQLPSDCIRLNTPVQSIRPGVVQLKDGTELGAKAVVVATEAAASAKLLGDAVETRSSPVRCFYFAADRPPLEEPILVLNGEGQGPINNLCVPSQIASSYAPSGQALISATVLGEHVNHQELLVAVRRQLTEWFGRDCKSWRLLSMVHLRQAIPLQTHLTPSPRSAERSDGVFVCGDHCDLASIQGALSSGQRAAEAVSEAAQQW